jgi:hypothetical protein
VDEEEASGSLISDSRNIVWRKHEILVSRKKHNEVTGMMAKVLFEIPDFPSCTTFGKLGRYGKDG